MSDSDQIGCHDESRNVTLDFNQERPLNVCSTTVDKKPH